MNVIRTVAQEASEDVFFGQVVIVWARWFLITSGALVILTGLDDQSNLIRGTVPIVLLMFMNLYLHGRYLMEKPVGVSLLLLTSLMDLVIITLLVFLWPMEADETRLHNQFFIFYYPMVLAFGFVMPRKIEIAYTVLAILLYLLVVTPDLGTSWALPWDDALQVILEQDVRIMGDSAHARDAHPAEDRGEGQDDGEACNELRADRYSYVHGVPHTGFVYQVPPGDGPGGSFCIYLASSPIFAST